MNSFRFIKGEMKRTLFHTERVNTQVIHIVSRSTIYYIRFGRWNEKRGVSLLHRT